MQQPLREELKIFTRPLHEAIENAYYPKRLTDRVLTLEEYHDYLTLFHAFHCVIEPWIESFPEWKAYDCDIALHRRIDFLIQDFTHFGLTPKPLEITIPLPHSFGFALGVLYVLEGSRVGGLMLSKTLESHFGLSDGKGYRYFCGNNDQSMQIWRTFCSILDKIDFPPQERTATVLGATWTFLYLRDLLDNNQ